MKICDFSKSNIQFPVAIVVSRFNEMITKALCDGAITRLKEFGFHDDQITVVWVPGAVEIPLITKKLAQTKKYEAIITLGAVIQGDTRHFDYVCKQVSDGCAAIALNYDIPVIFGVLTTDNLEQAQERIGGKHGHKGKEAAETAVEMVSLLREITHP
ncbi:MAG: 6,7-dimethyl-8-ribityllumazine synthase [Proteobacteria bacterium]|nr:6,7-dimethyl-8-ribityllumazine synthase [Pseudomonadota bacterium]